MKLSYRDKVIFVAAIVIVIIVAGIFLFIKPKFNEMNKAKLALEKKQTEQQDVNAKIDSLADIVAQLKSTAQDVEAIQDGFMIEQDPYLNEQYVRDILGNNVTTLSMDTRYTEVGNLTQYVVNPKNVVAYDLLMSGDIYNELPQEVYDVYNKNANRQGGRCTIGVTNMTVIYRDRVDYSGIYKFIDAVKDSGKTIIVTTFTKGEDEESATETDSTIQLRMYSIYPLNVEKVMEESDQFVFDPNAAAEEAAE